MRSSQELLEAHRELERRASQIARVMLGMQMLYEEHVASGARRYSASNITTAFLGVHESGLSVRVRYELCDNYASAQRKHKAERRKPKTFTVPVRYLDDPNWRRDWLAKSLRGENREWAAYYLGKHDLEALV